MDKQIRDFLDYVTKLADDVDNKILSKEEKERYKKILYALYFLELAKDEEEES